MRAPHRHRHRTDGTATALYAEPAEDDRTAAPGTLSAILADLSKPIPARLLKSKKMGGNAITFCPWHRVVKVLDFYTAGRWDYEVVDKLITSDKFMITVRITIHGSDRSAFRDGTGIEDLQVKGFGDSQSNAESMALRRAAAKFGLGLGLYEKED